MGVHRRLVFNMYILFCIVILEEDNCNVLECRYGAIIVSRDWLILVFSFYRFNSVCGCINCVLVWYNMWYVPLWVNHLTGFVIQYALFWVIYTWWHM